MWVSNKFRISSIVPSLFVFHFNFTFRSCRISSFSALVFLAWSWIVDFFVVKHFLLQRTDFFSLKLFRAYKFSLIFDPKILFFSFGVFLTPLIGAIFCLQTVKKKFFLSCLLRQDFFVGSGRSLRVLIHWLSNFCLALIFNYHPSGGVDSGVVFDTFSFWGEKAQILLIPDQGCCCLVFDLKGLCGFSLKSCWLLLFFCHFFFS